MISADRGAGQAIRLVAQREIASRAKTRSFVVTTLVLMVVIIVGAVVLSALTGDDDRDRIGVAGGDRELSAAIESIGHASGTSLEVVGTTDATHARSEVESGSLKAAVTAADSARYTVISDKALSPALDGVLRSAIDRVALSRSLDARGVDLATVGQATITVDQLSPDNPEKAQRIVIALVGTILLITAIMMGGSMVAVGVVEEKTSRVVELLLSTIKPLHLLWGKIIGIGTIALAQVLLLGVTALVAGAATGLLTVPSAAGGMFAAVIAWFLLGFLFFASLYAATGAIVSRQEELSASSAPLTVLAMAVMYAGIFGVQALDSRFVEILTWIPPFSAALMPIRIATGDTTPLQIVVTLILMIAACAATTWFASRIYQRSILRTGSRLRWSEVIALAR